MLHHCLLSSALQAQLRGQVLCHLKRRLLERLWLQTSLRGSTGWEHRRPALLSPVPHTQCTLQAPSPRIQHHKLQLPAAREKNPPETRDLRV